MEIYLPIAEMAVPWIAPLFIGTVVGVLSGLFGVGGGFLLNPLLIMMGVPPTVAVSTGALQIVAASVSGVVAHWQRGTVDLAMAACMTAGGLIGAFGGNRLFVLLKAMGHIDLVIALSYVVLLGLMGGLMLVESVRLILRMRFGGIARSKLHQHTFLHGLPLKVKFRKSRLYISVFLPLGLGVIVGLMTAIMGVGGGFLAVPAMIYLMGMPTMLTVGTSLVQITATSASVVYLQAISTHAVDMVLAALLILGGVAGAQFGAAFGQRLRSEHSRLLLSLMVLAVAAQVLYTLVVTPKDLFTLDLISES